MEEREEKEPPRLPDDVMLEIFRYLRNSELLSASNVCLRWRALALHPLLWRTRNVYVSSHNATAENILRLAPCLKNLMTKSWTLGKHQRKMLRNSRCAAESVTITSYGEMPDAHQLIRYQAALGRLKTLTLSLPLVWAGSSDLPTKNMLRVVSGAHGLEQLNLTVDHLSESIGVPVVPVSVRQPRPNLSLKKLNYTGCGCQLDFLLRVHAASLEEVHIHSSERCIYPYSSVAEGIAQSSGLRRLTCPPLEGMPSLARCRLLTSVSLNMVDTSSPAECKATEAYLRQASQLARLQISCTDVTLESVAGCLQALASSAAARPARPALQRLDVICYETGWGQQVPHLQLQPLVPFLNRLAQLRVLDMDLDSLPLPPDFVRTLKVASLRWLGLRIMECPHRWLREHDLLVRGLIRRNPFLHLRLPGCSGCSFCQPPASEDLEVLRSFHRSQREKLVAIGVFGHPVGAACGLQHTSLDYDGIKIAWRAL